MVRIEYVVNCCGRVYPYRDINVAGQTHREYEVLKFMGICDKCSTKQPEANLRLRIKNPL